MAEKIYKFEFSQEIMDNLYIMVSSCLEIGNSKIKFQNGRKDITLAEITVDVKRDIERQLQKLNVEIELDKNKSHDLRTDL